MTQKKILVVVGTRPEAIKMAPVILALKAAPWCECRVLATAQHRQMLDQVLNLFGIVPDIDLDMMRPNQSLPDLTARLIVELDRVLAAEAPDAVLVQGDTTTVMTAAMACFYRRIPVGHVEAGLRTGDMNNPFPEEMNRVVAGRLASWHFAPTESSQANLLREALPAERIHVTGNTVIDALLDVAARSDECPVETTPFARLVLVTAHRRENFGEPLLNICAAIRSLAARFPDTLFVYPVHPNPNVRETVEKNLSGLDNVRLIAPLDYRPFVALMKRADLILTDSGGVQEEAPALGKPVLVLRRETERPEAVTAGVVKLVGTEEAAIVDAARQLLEDPVAYAQMAKGVSPYGDGHAAERIVAIMREALAS